MQWASGKRLLANKTVLLTGASRGIGSELAHRLTEEGAQKLILVAHPWHEGDLHKVAKEVAECKTCGGTSVEEHLVDFSDTSATNRFAEECSSKGVDVLVNNAGIFGGRDSRVQSPLEGNPDEWEKTLKVNAMAPMRLTRAVAPGMKDKGSGYIINISDVEAHHTGPSHAAYAASKWALSGFSHSAYEALRSHGIKVVDIEPGNVRDTGMGQKSDMHAGGQGTIEPRDVVEAVMLCFRMSENAVPEEVIVKALRPKA